mgnify:CR=1 FL=1
MIRIGIEGEERRERLHAIADVAPHQQPALRRDVVAERQLRQVAAIERDQQTPEESAEDDPAGALVRRQAVGLALRVVELLLPRLDVDVGVGELAEVDLRPRHRDGRMGALHRHVAQDERRQALGREAVDRVHRHAVAVRVDQLLVDPVAAALRQLVDVELARGEHHLTHRAVDGRSDRCRCRESRSRCGSPESGAACPAAHASPTAGCSRSSRWLLRQFGIVDARLRRGTAAARDDAGRTPAASSRCCAR